MIGDRVRSCAEGGTSSGTWGFGEGDAGIGGDGVTFVCVSWGLLRGGVGVFDLVEFPVYFFEDDCGLRALVKRFYFWADSGSLRFAVM